jgi:hypothetical protein
MPLFLVGYPQGARRTVHDSSWVLFPNSLTNEDWGRLELTLVNEFVVDQMGSDVTYSKKKQFAAKKAADEMKNRYGPFREGNDVQYRHTAGGDVEYMGVECDTFPGDSGAPAITRERGTLVGILFKGIDTGSHLASAIGSPANPLRPGAKYHERILPIGLIVKELNDRFEKDWQKKYGVTIVP